MRQQYLLLLQSMLVPLILMLLELHLTLSNSQYYCRRDIVTYLQRANHAMLRCASRIAVSIFKFFSFELHVHVHVRQWILCHLHLYLLDEILFLPFDFIRPIRRRHFAFSYILAMSGFETFTLCFHCS